jgi:hypothetical protein
MFTPVKIVPCKELMRDRGYFANSQQIDSDLEASRIQGTKERGAYQSRSMQSGGIFHDLVNGLHETHCLRRIVIWRLVEKDTLHCQRTGIGRPAGISIDLGDNSADVARSISSPDVSHHQRVTVRAQLFHGCCVVHIRELGCSRATVRVDDHSEIQSWMDFEPVSIEILAIIADKTDDDGTSWIWT